MNRETAAPVACFGEILWDCLPRGLFLGGAPMNVAYHLSRLGTNPLLISAVGRDFLGDEACRRLDAWGLGRSLVGRVSTPTGTVQASLDDSGAANYTFSERAAWDFIPVPRSLLRRRPPAAIVFGTLALRKESNRTALDALLGAWPEALRVVDINLRPPLDRVDSIEWALGRATLLKLNTDELGLLNGTNSKSPVRWGRDARDVARRHALRGVCVTAGSRGAGLLWEGEWRWAEARPVIVRDTVGSGDAFLAALLAALLHRTASPGAALADACRLGEFVASLDGATPGYRRGIHGRPVAS